MDESLEIPGTGDGRETGGHKCAGQVLGTRMAMLGCRLVDIEEPRASRTLLVYVEIDRCATDAIQAYTGCRLGRRTLKYLDYGKVAATFVNTRTGAAARVVALEEAREAARRRAPAGMDSMEAQKLVYRTMSDEELFAWSPVNADVAPEDMPGRPRRRVVCATCGEGVNDGREVVSGGLPLCRPCASVGCYRPRVSAGQR